MQSATGVGFRGLVNIQKGTESDLDQLISQQSFANPSPSQSTAQTHDIPQSW